MVFFLVVVIDKGPVGIDFGIGLEGAQPTRRQSLYKNGEAGPHQQFKGFLKVRRHFTEVRRNECFHLFVAALKEERQREQRLFDIQRQQQFSNVRKVFIILAQNHAIGAQRHVLVLQVDNSVQAGLK